MNRLLVFFCLANLTACGNCGQSKPEPQVDPAASHAPSGEPKFHLNFDGGRRLRLHRFHDGGATHSNDGGATPPAPSPQ